MASFDEIRAIALGLPKTEERESGFSMGPSWRIVGGPQFAWSRPVTGKDLAWMTERGQQPPPEVLAVRVADDEAKTQALAAFEKYAFTIPHFDGFNAVLLRLKLLPVDLAEEFVVDSWRSRAPKRILQQWLRENDRLD